MAQPNTTSVMITDEIYGSDESDWGVDKVAGSSLVLALYGIICFLGVAGNLLVCIVLFRVPSLRSNTSDFLIHLSIVDLIVSLLVIPYKLAPTSTSSSILTSGFLGELWCRLYVGQYVFWVCAATSVMSLVTVSVERFVAIVYPLKYKAVFTKRNKYLMVAACWVLAGLCKMFVLPLYSLDGARCLFLGWPNRAVQASVGVCNFLAGLLVPFVVMVSTQVKVILTLKKQVQILTRRTADVFSLNKADQHEMWQLRTAQTLVKTLLTFVATFAVCWAPNQLIFLLYNLGMPFDFTSPLYHFGIVLAVGNSCANPIIYAMTNKPFRRGVRMAFRRRKITRRVDDVTAATVTSQIVTS